MKFRLSYTNDSFSNQNREVEIDSLEELIDLLIREEKPLILQENYRHDKDNSLPKYELEVYNDYRE